MAGDSTISRLWEIAAPLVADEGLEIIDIELRREGMGGRVLRYYLDKEGGANLDDLTRVSRQLSDLLDVHDILQTSYTLEVSTPGINRPLKRPDHFARFVGKKVKIRTLERIDGRRSFLGFLHETTGEGIVVLQDNRKVPIPYTLIEKANYEHDWGGEGKKR
jgi:ribosome maturation factor RimP